MTYNFSYIYPEMDSITRKEAAVHRCLDKDLSYQVYDNAYLLPSKGSWAIGKCLGGVVTKDFEFVGSSAWHEGKRCDKYDFEESEVREDDSTVIYMGFYNKIWGHIITDNLKKIWFLETEECKQLLKEGAKLIYITMDNEPMPSYVVRLFELAGVSLSMFVHVKELTRFRTIVVPDNSFVADNGQRYFTDRYVKTISNIKNNCKAENKSFPKKLYFTRTKLKNNREIGEKSIEEVFRRKGYTVIAPEQHSVDYQIQLLMNCISFAATEGSISHNVVFCNAGTDVVIIRKCNDVNKYQMAVNEVADVNVTYIDAHHSTRIPKNTPWVGPFFLYVNRQLIEWANNKMIYWPYYCMSSWYKYLYKDNGLYNKVKRWIHIIMNR